MTFTLEEHHKLHTQWINERHEFGQFNLTSLNSSPERVRAVGTVYWQAEFRGHPAPNVIKALVGEDWSLEKTPSGKLAFVLYMNTSTTRFRILRRLHCESRQRTRSTVLRSALRLGTRARCD